MAFAPGTDFSTLDNDMTAWFSKEDPVYVEYERFRAEFGGTRTLIVALEGDGIFTPAGLEFIRRITADIERVEAVDRVQSLATANFVSALPDTPGEDGGIAVDPLLRCRAPATFLAAMRCPHPIGEPP